MTVEIKIGPPQLVINQGDTILVTGKYGQIPWPSDKGLYFLHTRLISSWNIFANGGPFELLNFGAITHYAARVYLTNPVIETEQGDIPDLLCRLCAAGRSVAGFVRREFADLFEVKSKHIIRPRAID
jgi:hypothetical protein